MRFKVGDRIVDLECLHYGVGTITKHTGYSGWEVLFSDREGPVWRNDDDRDLVLEDVYNSPLMKALR